MGDFSREAAICLATKVESALGQLYDFIPLAAVQSHILGREELLQLFGDSIKHNENFLAQGALWIYNHLDHSQKIGTDDDVSDISFLGIHFCDSIFANLALHNPIAKLDQENLNSFWTVVEEVSHFHLVLNRTSQNRPIGKMELECQADIDKIILGTYLLQSQLNLNHFETLKHLLFNQSRLYLSNSDLYYQASQVSFGFASQLGAIVEDKGLNSDALFSSLRSFYHAPLSEKSAIRSHAA